MKESGPVTIAAACPFCRAPAPLGVLGPQRVDCPGCRRAFWVSLPAPVVSTVGPELSGTITDLGPGVSAQPTVLGLEQVKPKLEAQRETANELVAVPQKGRLALDAQPTLEPLRPVPDLRRGPRRDASTASTIDEPAAEPPKRNERSRALNRPTSSGPVAPESAAPGLALGGLELLARIGGGGMGTVWLARQVSLDRNVAVKVLRPELGGDPAFVIQFTREALAAAQLVHHNIAQIYDIGFDHGLHYFSMEYIDGEPLSALVKREGRVDPEVAAGYALQAARGLKFAHDRGLVHRDVKPDNLLLNLDGIVKVADLGLVKRVDGTDRGTPVLSPSSTVADIDFVPADVIVGSPAYMAPEQALSATTVDHRSDIYSLGCTLYALLTGRPPFEGATSGQVLLQHLKQAPTPPEQANHRVPKALSAIALRMMAKQPAARFADMAGVISALEAFLGIEAGAFSPREEHALIVERCGARFHDATWARRRRIGRLVFLASVIATVSGAAALGFWAFAAWAAVLIGSATVTSSVIDALARRSALLKKLRHLALGAPLWTWAVGSAVVGLAIGGLAWSGHLRTFLENVGLAMAVGLGSFLLLDRRVTQERRPIVHELEELLKTMRLRGLEEQKLRQFICKYSGTHWEELYEALFGYEAKLDARARWGRDDQGEERRRHGVWRDPLVRFIDRRLETRRAAKERAQLAAVGEGADQPRRGKRGASPPRRA